MQFIKKRNGDQHGAGVRTNMTMEEFCEKELPPLADIVGFCSNLPMSVYSDSTVVKSPEVVYRGLVLSRNRFISEEFLLNFRRSEPDMGAVIGVNNYHLPMVLGALASRKLKEDRSQLISLPRFRNVKAPIGSVIRSRRSVRVYSGRTMPIEDLADILYYGQGISGKLELNNMPETVTLEGKDEIDLRTAPSGGGLNPVDLYIFALNVQTLEKGAYLYLPQFHALKKVCGLDKDFEPGRLAQFGEIEVDKSNLLLVYVYKLFDNSRKYGDSGMAYAFIETGEISENIHLTATALGIGTCDVGGYAKKKIEQVLGLDGMSKHVIHLMTVGK